MKHTYHIRMRVALRAMLGIACLASAPTMAAEPAWWTQMKNDCRARGGTIADAYNTAVAQGGCQLPSQSSPSSPAYDYGAERRQAEQERLRRQEEEERRADDERRLKFERERKEAQERFIRERDAAASALRGGVGVSGTAETLRGAGAQTAPVLRESSTTSTSPELRDAVASTNSDRNISPAQVRAWQQLNCAAFIMRHALKSVVRNGDYDNLRYLSAQATKSMDGARLDVQCDPAPPFPSVRGNPADMERLRISQRQLIDSAQAIGSRMEQREAALPDSARQALKEVRASAPAPGAATRPETDIERLRRVQLALNRINEGPIVGRTAEAIQQQEKDRIEMGKKLLIAEKIEKGDVDASINLTTSSRTRRAEVPSPRANPERNRAQ